MADDNSKSKLHNPKFGHYLSIFASRRMAVMVLLGFASGLPLPLTTGTLQAWLTMAGLDLRTIGIFSLVGLPYAVKFLWAPLMDRFAPPWLGRRRGWILLAQACIVAAIVLMVFFAPERAPLAFALTALALAFVSASQDIVIDAYRTDVLPEAERGLGAAVFVLGYRIALLMAGALALIMADHIGWRTTYLIMAGCMAAGMAGTLFGRSPAESVAPPVNIKEAVYGAFHDFLSRPSAALFLLLIVLYKMGDAYAGALTTTFLLRGVGFSATDVGVINKGMGLAATVVGALFGGTLMIKLGLFRSLLLFGVLQMVSNLSFLFLAWVGKSYPAMVFAVAFENISGGMGTAAFVAFLMTLCNPRYSATQFALLSSLSAVGRVAVSPTAGYLVEGVGWVVFFAVTALAALPGLILLMRLRQPIDLLTGHQERRVNTGPRKGWGG